MENEIGIEFPGSSLTDSAFYNEYHYDPQDYDKALDKQADAILEQCDDFSESEFYQESVLDTIAGFSLMCVIGGVKLFLNPTMWPEVISGFAYPDWWPLYAGISGVCIAGYVAAFKGIQYVVRVCKAGQYVHKSLCEIAEMISNPDIKIQPRKVVKAFKNLKKNLKALNSRFNKFTASERKAISDLIDSTNNIITITKKDVLETEALKKKINDFLEDAKKVDDIIANPETEQEMVSVK
jgi:DNA-directed RNA polymerase subunit L